MSTAGSTTSTTSNTPARGDHRAPKRTLMDRIKDFLALCLGFLSIGLILYFTIHTMFADKGLLWRLKDTLFSSVS